MKNGNAIPQEVLNCCKLTGCWAVLTSSTRWQMLLQLDKCCNKMENAVTPQKQKLGTNRASQSSCGLQHMLEAFFFRKSCKLRLKMFSKFTDLFNIYFPFNFFSVNAFFSCHNYKVACILEMYVANFWKNL